MNDYLQKKKLGRDGDKHWTLDHEEIVVPKTAPAVLVVSVDWCWVEVEWWLRPPWFLLPFAITVSVFAFVSTRAIAMIEAIRWRPLLDSEEVMEVAKAWC